MMENPRLPLAFPPAGLYAITGDRHGSPEQLAAAVRAALRGGARVIQYRAKSRRDRLAEARLLLAECRSFRVPLIINDEIGLAETVGADGVHLGKDDGGIAEARNQLGENAIIGVSCYDSVERALQAQADGADYVAFGRFFPSSSKPDAPNARLGTLTRAKQCIELPIVAIGGITPGNGRALIEAGADLLAVIDAVFGGKDPYHAALAFMPWFAEKTE